MNTKAVSVKSANVAVKASRGDIARYILAVIIVAGGFAVFYWVPQWPAPVRALLIALSFVAALGVMALTHLGHRGREFLSESMFELRKVVWPTRREAVRITGVVLLVVALISLILAGFDSLISWLIKLLLSN